MTPKITADNIAEHVERQEQAVFEAAVRLFTERGYDNVSLGEIAAEVGLARNSLYRYFPGKSEILARWVNRELEDGIERSDELLGGEGTASDRILRWADDQIEYARRPEHDLLVSMASAGRDLDTATLGALAQNHDRLRQPLLATVGEIVTEPADVEITADLIVGLVHAASRLDISRPAEAERIRELLHRGITRLLEPG